MCVYALKFRGLGVVSNLGYCCLLLPTISTTTEGVILTCIVLWFIPRVLKNTTVADFTPTSNRETIHVYIVLTIFTCVGRHPGKASKTSIARGTQSGNATRGPAAPVGTCSAFPDEPTQKNGEVSWDRTPRGQHASVVQGLLLLGLRVPLGSE